MRRIGNPLARAKVASAVVGLAAVLLLTVGTFLHAMQRSHAEKTASLGTCYFCALEVCGSDMTEHWDADGQSFSKATHNGCTTAACDHGGSCSVTFARPAGQQIDGAVSDPTGRRLAELVARFPEAVHINTARGALQIIGCQGAVVEHHRLSAVQVAVGVTGESNGAVVGE